MRMQTYSVRRSYVRFLGLFVLIVIASGAVRTTFAAYAVDDLYPQPGFNFCWFGGNVYYENDLPIALATTNPADSSACNAMQMYVSLQFYGSDYQWHWYPIGFVWVQQYGGLITSDEPYWTNHAHGWHQMFDFYGCSCASTNYQTDTN